MALCLRLTLAALLQVVPATLLAQDTVRITAVAVQHVARKGSQPMRLYLAPRVMPGSLAELSSMSKGPPPMVAGLDAVASAAGARVAPVDFFDICIRPSSPAPECARDERIGLISVSLPMINADRASLAVSISCRNFGPEAVLEKARMSYATYRVVVVRRGTVWTVSSATITSGS